jgi:hypothetical protein
MNLSGMNCKSNGMRVNELVWNELELMSVNQMIEWNEIDLGVILMCSWDIMECINMGVLLVEVNNKA